MDRRAFLERVAIGSVALAGLGARPSGGDETRDANPLAGALIVDAHAHPDQFMGSNRPDPSSTLESITALGMAASSWAALGDRQTRRGAPWQPETLYDVQRQLDVVRGLAKRGRVRLVLSAADIASPSPGTPPGAILALEGAHPVGTDVSLVDTLHAQGVRTVTLMHYGVSELGDCMTSPPMHRGLSAAGRKVVERMQRLGILVDVAHADSRTLRQIVEVMDRPVVDSHTGPCGSPDGGACGRQRDWADMERVAQKGGVICSWPLARSGPEGKRETFHDWALELLEMRRRLGAAHVGIGTDGGGSLPARIRGYRDVRDLVTLARSMREVGFTPEDLAAVFGGNVRRVFQHAAG